MAAGNEIIGQVDEEARRRFERAWLDGRPKPIDEFLPDGAELSYAGTLEELVCIELEFLWRAWGSRVGLAVTEVPGSRKLGVAPPRVEDYLVRYPDLGTPETLQRLIEYEIRVRREIGDTVVTDEYSERFPQLIIDWDELSTGAHPRPPLPRLPQYEVLGYLGGGGMGEIYKARHIHLDRTVVVKWLRSDVPVNPQAEARFAREMKAVGQVTHPNVVNATDGGIVDGRRYLVMEYIDGIDLSALCKCVGPLPIADACEIVRQAALGLARAHQSGIVHRDIKPTNIMLASEGLVKVLDLGLALLQREDDSADHTLTSVDSGPFGTYDYMSPEQWGDTHNVDYRTDLYSLGCTLYFLLCGHAPFADEQHTSPAAKMRGHVLENAPPIQADRPDVPDELRDLLGLLLGKEPDQRLSSAGELVDALARFTSGCDLKNLISSAHGGNVVPIAECRTSNPESQTVLVAPSAPQRPKSPRDIHEGVTKLSDSETQTAMASAPVRAPANRAARWLFAATAAAALFTAGAAASIFYVISREDRGTTPAPSIAESTVTVPVVPADTAVDPVPGEDSRTGPDPEATDRIETEAANQTDTEVAVPAPDPVPAVVPEFEPLPLQELRENEAVTVLVPLKDSQALRGKVAFTLGPDAPKGMRIDAETGVIRWQPEENDGGTGKQIEVTVLARSLDPAVASAETTVSFKVLEVNQSPRLAKLWAGHSVAEIGSRLSATEGEPFQLTLVLDDADVPANSLDLAPVGSLPRGAQLRRSAESERTWLLTWTPGEEFGGADDVQIRLQADDGIVREDLGPLRIAVAEVNQPPVISSVNGVSFDAGTPWTAEVAEGRPLELTIQTEDADVPANGLTLSAVEALPTGASLEPIEQNPRAWKLRWTPGEVIGGGDPVTILLRASDAEASSDVAAIVVTVDEVNVAPVLTSMNGTDVREQTEFTATIPEGQPFELTLVAADTDLPPNPLSLQPVETLPDGARITAVDGKRATWQLVWTPDEKIGGSGKDVRIPLCVFDGETRSEPRTVVVRVDEVNTAPEFASIGGSPLNDERSLSVAVDEGTPLSVEIAGADADVPANRLTVVASDDLPEGARIVPDENDPRLWRFVWTPTEAQGGFAPFEIPLSIRDDDTNSRQAMLLVRVDEVNSKPVIAEIEPQSAGPGEEFLLDINVFDADLPRQELSVELRQPEELDARWFWLPAGEGARQTLRFLWQPDGDRDVGKSREFTVHVTDNGKPPYTATRKFEVSVGRSLTNSIGMELALIPSGHFRMGNLNPEQLEELLPKAPKIPERPNPQPGARLPFGNQPGFPLSPPGIPRPQPAVGGGEEDREEQEEVDRPDDVPVRDVPVTTAFYMGQYEVTQAQYRAVMGENPSYHSATGGGRKSVKELDTESFPVESVSYAQAREFCRRLSALPEERERGRVYRLPSEIEWEYACRAGTETMFHTGERLSSNDANFDGRFPASGTRRGPYLERSTTVGSYKPNDFGLYDMHGNVAEWCSDWYAADAYERDFEWFGPKEGTRRVVRGGSYRSQRAYQCRSAGRDSRDPSAGSPRIGFRVVCVTAVPLVGADEPAAGEEAPR